MSQVTKTNQLVYGPASRACQSRDYVWVAGWLNGRFGVDVCPEWVKAKMATIRPNFCWDWSDGSWAMWWKNRIEEESLFRTRLIPPVPVCFLTEIHTGFLMIPETESELDRLFEDNTPIPSGPSTPGIARTLEKPTPIDRVAARVSHFLKDDE